MRYVQRFDGEWHTPVRRGYKMMCCDCGLVHRIDFRLVQRGNGRRIQMRAYRNDRATALSRRHRKGLRVPK